MSLLEKAIREVERREEKKEIGKISRRKEGKSLKKTKIEGKRKGAR